MFLSDQLAQQFIWLIPIPPLLSFALIVLFTNRSKAASHTVAIGLMGLSWVMSWLVFFKTLGLANFGAQVVRVVTDWLPFGSPAVGTQPLQMGALVDPLTGLMLFFVPLACLLIFIYSVGYSNYGVAPDPHDVPGTAPHGVEPLYSRFFAYLSLFAFGMLLLVVADNLLLLFVGWEIMGLCSYLLIGFWYARDYPDPKQITPRQAAIKAFMTTRVGDMFMMLGIVYLYSQAGTLSFREILYNPLMLDHLAGMPSMIAYLTRVLKTPTIAASWEELAAQAGDDRQAGQQRQPGGGQGQHHGLGQQAGHALPELLDGILNFKIDAERHPQDNAEV